MNNPVTHPDDAALMLTLALLPCAAGTRALAQFLEVDEHTVQSSLHNLEQYGLVGHQKDHGTWLVSDRHARRELGGRALRPRADLPEARPEALLEGLALLWKGHLLEGVRLLGPVLRGRVYTGHTAGALVCLDILLHALARWKEAAHSTEENEQFLSSSTKILGSILYLAKKRRRTDTVFAITIRVANSLGDKRSALQLKLMLVCLHYMTGGVLEENPQETMDRINEEMRELGDEDILTGAAHAVGLQLFVRGRFAEALDNYKHYGTDSKNERFYSGILLNYVSIAACNLGKFGTALGIVTYALRIAEEFNGKYALRRTKILAGDVLLRAGKPDDALKMMDEAWTCCDLEAESRLAMWALRNLAFYHFQMRRMAQSYKLLAESARVAAKDGIRHPFRWFPDIFEMLWAFQEHGFPPIPGHRLEELLPLALGAPCLQTQGIVLRIQARQRFADRDYTTALQLLETSLERLRQSGNPVEQARTKLAMVQSLERLGRHAEAAAMQAKGCAVLEEYRQYDRFWHCPNTTSEKQHNAHRDGAECARAWREISANTPDWSWSTFETHLQWTVDCLRDALQVERVALFSVRNNYELLCLVARDFSTKEQNEKLPGMYGKRMLDCIQSGKIGRWRSRYGACLCLPLKLPREQDAILFAQSAYLVDSILERDEEYFEPIKNLLEEEIRLVYRIKASVNELQRKEEIRSRLTAERLVDIGGIYYGPAMREMLEQADKAALTTAPILILGETGTGKEELSRRIHRKSGRAGPFIPVNAASIPEQLFESELFGHEKGAFTGAHQQKIGLLELAHKGTLFIDEIGDIPLALQVKLLRVLQDGKFARLGGTTLIHSNFRLISATHQNLAGKIRDGMFREDFYYRIAVVPLTMLPLRERPEDIRHLAVMFHEHFSSLYKKGYPPLTREELDDLCSRPWPGNVRELRSFIERNVILHDPDHGGFIQEPPGEFFLVPREPAPSTPDQPAENTSGEKSAVFCCDELLSLEELQKRYIRHVLELTRGKVGGEGGARDILDMKLSSLYKKMKKYGLDKTTLIYGSSKK